MFLTFFKNTLFFVIFSLFHIFTALSASFQTIDIPVPRICKWKDFYNALSQNPNYNEPFDIISITYFEIITLKENFDTYIFQEQACPLEEAFSRYTDHHPDLILEISCKEASQNFSLNTRSIPLSCKHIQFKDCNHITKIDNFLHNSPSTFASIDLSSFSNVHEVGPFFLNNHPNLTYLDLSCFNHNTNIIGNNCLNKIPVSADLVIHVEEDIYQEMINIQNTGSLEKENLMTDTSLSKCFIKNGLHTQLAPSNKFVLK